MGSRCTKPDAFCPTGLQLGQFTFLLPIVALEEADLPSLSSILSLSESIHGEVPVQDYSHSSGYPVCSLPSGPRSAEQIRVEYFHAFMICCRWQADPQYLVRVFHLLLFSRAECPLHDGWCGYICLLLMDLCFWCFNYQMMDTYSHVTVVQFHLPTVFHLFIL